jgi:pimeloyl-ACP methyl ester carboxylesterase
MRDPHRLPRRSPALAAAAAVLAALAAGPARADLIFLKDGFVLQGQVRRESVTQFDPYSKEPVIIPKGFFLVDDGPRKIYFSPSQVRIVEKMAPPQEERVSGLDYVILNPRVPPPILEVLEAPEWDSKWERGFRYRSIDGTVGMRQRVLMVTPYWVRVDAVTKFHWAGAYLTRELGREAVQQLLASAPRKDFQPRPKETAPQAAARMLRYVDFCAQAGWFDDAAKELDKLAAAQPDQKERVESARAALRRMQARERFEEIKHLHQAGRALAVRAKLAGFPEKFANTQMLSTLHEIRAECDATDAALKQAGSYLDAVARQLSGPDARVLAEAVAAIRAELDGSSVERLDAFLGQARQAERQRQKGHKPDLRPEELLSLAVTGWLQGSPSAEARPDAAVRLWKARQMVLAYQRTPEQADRERLLKDYEQEQSSRVGIDEIMQLIPFLPPAEATKDLGTKPAEVKLGVGRGAVTYHVQLPPEYRHDRPYPVLIALPDAGEAPDKVLARWAEAAAEQGYVVAVPEWVKGLGGSYSYSEREHDVVLQTLRDLRRRYQVDSDRVFLFGLGEGGKMAFDVGLGHPDLFAGVIPMGADPDGVPLRCWRNAQYLPFYVVNGSRTGDGAKKTRELFDRWILTGRGYPGLWVEYKGRGVEWLGGEVPNIFDWMRNKRRAFPLKQLGTDGLGGSFGNEFCTMRSCDNRFWWLSTRAISPRCLFNSGRPLGQVTAATLHGSINPEANDVFLKVAGLKQVTVWLGRNARGTNMVDFDRPLSVRVGFQAKVYNRRIKPSLAVLLEDLYQRGDRQQMYLAKIDIDL